MLARFLEALAPSKTPIPEAPSTFQLYGRDPWIPRLAYAASRSGFPAACVLPTSTASMIVRTVRWMLERAALTTSLLSAQRAT